MKRIVIIIFLLLIGLTGISHAAVGAATNWYVRAGGGQTNGGGYDSTISGAGTNYCDQDATQLSLTDLATPGAGSTTLTSATGGFTAAMIGNCIRIASGTNFQTGYYFVTACTDTNTVTLDRTPTSGAAGSSGVGKLGGAHATIVNYTNYDGGLGAPLIATPLVAGNTINIRGAGTDDPAVADYTHTGYGYWQAPSGDLTSGCITFKGYNGRPLIDVGSLLLHATTYWRVENIKFRWNDAAFPANSLMSSGFSYKNCIFDQNGYDVTGIVASVVVDCWFKNSGSTAAGTYPAINQSAGYGSVTMGNYINGWRGYGILNSYIGTVINNIIVNCKSTTKGAVEVTYVGGTSHCQDVINNTINGNASDGIKVLDVNALQNSVIYNNIISNNGGYGLNYSVGSTVLNDRTVGLAPDYNDFYNNTSGARNNISAGSNDLALDPQYTNSSGGNYAIGANLKSKGFPAGFRGSSTTGYTDIGGVHSQGSSSSGTFLNNASINNARIE